MKTYISPIHFIFGLSLTLCASLSLAASRTVDLPLSSSLSLKGYYKVDIQQDESLQKTQINIKGDDESSVKDLKVEGNEQGILISYPNHVEPKKALTLEIRANKLENLSSQGNSSIKVTSVTTPQFMLNLDGNSNVTISKIKTTEFKVKTKGDTDLTLAGETNSLALDLFGNSKINAIDLAANKAVLNSKGNADIQINVKETLERNIEGRTALSVKGQPITTGQARGVIEVKEIK